MPSLPTPLGLSPSFGFGDRIGVATRGHVAAVKRCGAGIAPIFPQQSIREMARTSRSPQQVMDDAMHGAKEAGWTDAIGADADHLKTPDDVNVTAAVGFTFFTIDPSGSVDQKADNYDASTVRERFKTIAANVPWFGEYSGRVIELSKDTKIEIDELACMRAAVKYGKAIDDTIALAKHIESVQKSAGREYEIELSVDETDQPTTLAEHFIIAEQCLRAGVKLVSLAPRFIGDFEKGVDYKGDITALERSLADHATIARTLGPYKLSLHSGSDKISIYTALAKATAGLFHVKTAGTSYLEALRVVAKHDPASFREIISFARSRYDVDKATYHVSAKQSDAPEPTRDVSDSVLEAEYLECWATVPEGKGFTKPGRQILHCTFGSVLTDKKLGPLVKDVLHSHLDTYESVLDDHFGRHLDALVLGIS
jgi:tagaturonate epimerase